MVVLVMFHVPEADLLMPPPLRAAVLPLMVQLVTFTVPSLLLWIPPPSFDRPLTALPLLMGVST